MAPALAHTEQLIRGKGRTCTPGRAPVPTRPPREGLAGSYTVMAPTTPKVRGSSGTDVESGAGGGGGGAGTRKKPTTDPRTQMLVKGVIGAFILW
jgi:hypothetical protein